ncbi:hypothetical protein [Syntrophomonas erecta]
MPDHQKDKKTAYLFDIVCNNPLLLEHLNDPLYQVYDFNNDDDNHLIQE